MAKLPSEVNNILDKLYDEDIPTIRRGKRLNLGQLLLYGYNAKYKAELPYWDMLPLMILLTIDGTYMQGINLHYIPYTYRVNLVKNIYEQFKSGQRLKYRDVKKAVQSSKVPAGYMYFAFRKYLVNRIQTNIKYFDEEIQWQPVVANVLPQFKKKKDAEIMAIIRSKLKEYKKK